MTQTYDYYDWNEQMNGRGQGGRLENLTVGFLQILDYEYDAVGNIKKITNNIAGETNNYGYDALNRLQSWSLNGASESYTYDSAGNLDMKASVDLNYNDVNHVHAVTHIGSIQKYWYDANGNQTTRVIGTDTFTLLYDAENRLVEVKKNNATQMKFSYDGDGRRVKSEAYNNGVVTETILFIGGHFEVTGSQVTKYYYAGTTRIAMRKDGTLSYLLGDHLGSTSVVTSATGGLVMETRYKPWGEVRYVTPDNTLPTRYTYTGQYSYMNDEATDLGSAGFDLMFYNARWYDPYLNHFTQPDSIVPDPSNPQAWDRYAYALNNPVRYSDPSGHRTTGACGVEDEQCAIYTPAEIVNKRENLQCNKSACTWKTRVLADQLEDYLQTHPDYSPLDDPITYGNDKTVCKTCNMANNHWFGASRKIYWERRIQATGASDTPFELYTYYDQHSHAIVNAEWQPIDWQDVKFDTIGLFSSFIGLNTIAKLKPLTNTISFVGGSVSLGHSLAGDDFDSKLLSFGGMIPGPTGVIFSGGSLLKDLLPGFTYSPYIPSIPRNLY